MTTSAHAQRAGRPISSPPPAAGRHLVTVPKIPASPRPPADFVGEHFAWRAETSDCRYLKNAGRKSRRQAAE